MVRKIRFKFPVSVDGGLTYSEVVDLDDGTTPDGGPPSGGGGPLPPITPIDDSDFQIDGILPLDSGDFMSDNVLPNPSTASTMLGHYSAGFTLNTYTHATTRMQEEAASRMGSYMTQNL